jgi:hypothetical protein
VGKGGTQPRSAQGIGTRSRRQSPRGPLTLTRCSGLECTEARRIHLATIANPNGLDGLVDAEAERASGNEGGHQPTHQDAARRQAGPVGPAQNAADELTLPA